jgi:hypothetical protein
MIIRVTRVTSIGIIVAHVAEPFNTLKLERFTQVEGSFTTMPAFWKPMKAIMIPEPGRMTCLNSSQKKLAIRNWMMKNY